ncbi:hypothetical protein F5144DRAFT_608434 [Chaetomium tenue]|uniref:Uncharacterized protein n=1 Tax=Chaetomium tenue TaxID=1854479 RepID=A0ACB7PR55_9PEZI|nr:hypothetical protein F5144DRAFT_608434 [Chaetomium globosum]
MAASPPTFSYPQTVKYRCHIVEYGIVVKAKKYGWSDHRRSRKVMKLDELCPKCERKLERKMLRNLHWLNDRNDFTIEYVYLYRDGESPMSSPEWPLYTESESESVDEHRSPPWAMWAALKDEENEADDEAGNDHGGNDDEKKEEAEEQSPEQKLLSGLLELLGEDWGEEFSEGEESLSTAEGKDGILEVESMKTAGPSGCPGPQELGVNSVKHVAAVTTRLMKLLTVIKSRNSLLLAREPRHHPTGIENRSDLDGTVEPWNLNLSLNPVMKQALEE